MMYIPWTEFFLTSNSYTKILVLKIFEDGAFHKVIKVFKNDNTMEPNKIGLVSLKRIKKRQWKSLLFLCTNRKSQMEIPQQNCLNWCLDPEHPASGNGERNAYSASHPGCDGLLYQPELKQYVSQVYSVLGETEDTVDSSTTDPASAHSQASVIHFSLFLQLSQAVASKS